MAWNPVFYDEVADFEPDIIDLVIRQHMRRESARRERIVVDALLSGAMLNELGTVEEVGGVNSWRLW